MNSIICEKSYDVALIKRLAELPEFSEIGRTLFANGWSGYRMGSYSVSARSSGGLFAQVLGK